MFTLQYVCSHVRHAACAAQLRLLNLILQNLAETTAKELQLQLQQTEKAAMGQQQQLADKDDQLKSVKQDLQQALAVTTKVSKVANSLTTLCCICCQVPLTHVAC